MLFGKELAIINAQKHQPNTHDPPQPQQQHQVSTGKSTARPAAWHPGPGGHALRGRIIAYHYLRLLDDALADVYDAKVHTYAQCMCVGGCG